MTNNDRCKRLLRLVLFLKELEEEGVTYDLSTLDGRVALHNTVYIAQEMGIDLGYKFNSYLRAPYSSELANDIQVLLKVKRDPLQDIYDVGILESYLRTTHVSESTTIWHICSFYCYIDCEFCPLKNRCVLKEVEK